MAMSFEGIKGTKYLDEVWDKAVKRGCLYCDITNNETVEQYPLGAVYCITCQNPIISQEEVDKMEKLGLLPKSKK
ncbi:hypothetical protein [Enterococcus sp. AZ103]|uniref:hypothetical protein n=1 Tax=Enterococcus sp. AZ103 TaxID=2774628 RepID=UPI003F29C4C3